MAELSGSGSGAWPNKSSISRRRNAGGRCFKFEVKVVLTGVKGRYDLTSTLPFGGGA